jgi:nitrite reductase/ring-hydroxylating ferredoxin subunit
VRFEVLRADALAPGEMRAVDVDGVSVVIIRKADGTYRALRNRCAHQGAPLSDGRLEPLIEGSAPGQYRYSAERQVVRCPYHHFEFDVDSGMSPADSQRLRVRAYPCAVSDGMLYVER